MDIAIIEQRSEAIKASLKTIKPEGWTLHGENLRGAVQGTLSVLTVIYGAESLPVASFQARLKPGQDPAVKWNVMPEDNRTDDVEKFLTDQKIVRGPQAGRHRRSSPALAAAIEAFDEKLAKRGYRAKQFKQAEKKPPQAGSQAFRGYSGEPEGEGKGVRQRRRREHGRL